MAQQSTARRVYLLGTVFSGSTVFGQALGAADSVVYLGEVDRLVQFGPTMWADEPEATCHYCELRGQPCPVWTPDRIARVRKLPYGQLMDFFQEELGDQVMIDGSKHPRWLQTVLSEDGVDPNRTVAFLTARSPFAFCDSFRARTDCQIWEAANVWRDVNYDALRLVSRIGLPVMVVRYEQFALDPESILRPACALLGIDYSPDMRFFQQKASHDVGGNYNARAVAGDGDVPFDAQEMKTKIPAHWVPATQSSQTYWGKPFGGWVDSKWQQNTTEAELDVVLQTPGLPDLANLLGYQLSRDITAWQRRRDRLT